MKSICSAMPFIVNVNSLKQLEVRDTIVRKQQAKVDLKIISNFLSQREREREGGGRERENLALFCKR